MGQDGWDSFDFETWGREGGRGGAGDDGDTTASPDQAGETEERPDSGAREAGWMSLGGVLRWADPEDEDSARPGDLQSEARSRWASEAIDLPPGAPDYLRLRSLRAWLLRQRLLETEAIGQLLLERRRQDAGNDGADEDTPESPLELELARRQAAVEVYEALVESLDEMVIHSGPARILVEFYLWLDERLALLASIAPADVDPSAYGLRPYLSDETTDNPAAQETTSPATARSIAEWQGRALAALQARRRIEQVSQPEPED